MKSPLVFNKLSRRFFLRGAGSSVALPFLPSLLPREARAAVPNPGLIVFRQANGVQCQGYSIERFWPSALGPLALGTTDINRAVSELKDYQSKLLIIKNLDLANYQGHNDAFLLTGTSARPAGATDSSTAFGASESIDNRIARELHPGVDPLTFFCGIRTGYVDDKMSWRGSNDLRAGERDPKIAYSRMIAAGGVDAITQLRVSKARKSINDIVRAELTSLKMTPQISAEDSMRLQQHFDSVRDVERSLACAADASKSMQLDNATSILNNDAYIETIAKLQMDVVALSLSCGHTRVATMQMGGGNSHTRYTVNGTLQTTHHSISHNNIVGAASDGSGPSMSNPDYAMVVERASLLLHQIDRLHGRLFKYLLDRLSAYGIMDSTTSVWCNHMAIGHHASRNTPFIIAGGNGYFKQGQCVDAQGALHNKLLNSLLNAVGLRNNGQLIVNFGNGTAPNGELTVAKA
jgi:hypothetical protein